ncbi:hypothetical protein Trydic_g22582 [Trypoxylus dichotomus]
MATSLAAQLQKLAVPQTTLLKQDKKRASLLFDEKQAAEISREAFYQIGVEGFEELKLKCPAFTPFENTLFHATSKGFERSVQSSLANERRFIECGVVEEECNEIHRFIFALLSDVQLENSFVSQLISTILEVYTSNRKNASEEIQQWLKTIMSTIEAQYPQAFDKENFSTEMCFANCNQSGNRFFTAITRNHTFLSGTI